MATDKRSKPNSYFAWYVESKGGADKIAFLERKTSSDSDGTYEDGWQSFTGENFTDPEEITSNGEYITINPLSPSKLSEDIEVHIEITTNGTPDKFKYSLDGGLVWSAEIDLLTTFQEIATTNINIKFDSTDGYTLGSKWRFTAYGNNYEGLKIEGTARYVETDDEDDDLYTNLGLDEGLNLAIVDYIKFRLLEDMGKFQEAIYFWKKFKDRIRRFPNRKIGRRMIKVPKL